MHNPVFKESWALFRENSFSHFLLEQAQPIIYEWVIGALLADASAASPTAPREHDLAASLNPSGNRTPDLSRTCQLTKVAPALFPDSRDGPSGSRQLQQRRRLVVHRGLVGQLLRDERREQNEVRPRISSGKMFYLQATFRGLVRSGGGGGWIDRIFKWSSKFWRIDLVNFWDKLIIDGHSKVVCVVVKSSQLLTCFLEWQWKNLLWDSTCR